jgi:hypothetical protein
VPLHPNRVIKRNAPEAHFGIFLTTALSAIRIFPFANRTHSEAARPNSLGSGPVDMIFFLEPSTFDLLNHTELQLPDNIAHKIPANQKKHKPLIPFIENME